MFKTFCRRWRYFISQVQISKLQSLHEVFNHRKKSSIIARSLLIYLNHSCSNFIHQLKNIETHNLLRRFFFTKKQPKNLFHKITKIISSWGVTLTNLQLKLPYSHSIVAGGLLVISNTTLEMPDTSPMMRLLTLDKNSFSKT